MYNFYPKDRRNQNNFTFFFKALFHICTVFENIIFVLRDENTRSKKLEW